jgi:hypothetical protein
LLGVTQNVSAAQRTWANTGTDFNAGGSWGGTAPGLGDVGLFTAAAVTQPNLSASLSIAGLLLQGTGSSGYDLTGSAGTALTLTGRSTSGSNGSADSSAAAIRNEITSGANTIHANLLLASTTGISTFFNAAAGGGTLILDGAIGESGGAHSLSLKSGIFQLNAANTFTGGVTIDASATTVVLGNNGALGSGTFSINNTATVQAGGGNRTLANSMVIGGNTTFSGSNALTFNGTVTSSGSSSRTLTVNNTGGATLGGNVFLQEAGASGRTFTINGTSQITINGVVADGGVGPATLKYTGSSILTLSNTNTYSGGTQLTISGSTIVATANGAFGTGNVSLMAGAVVLTLQGPMTKGGKPRRPDGNNDFIADTATLSIGFADDTVNLNYNGTETIGALIVNGTAQMPGVYSSANLSELVGTGTLTVVPEPSTWILFGLGALIGVQRFRRKRC